MALHIGRSRLPYWRKHRNITQADLAEYLGVTQPFISKIERNVEKLPYEMAANIADYLVIDMIDLYEWRRVP